MELKSKKSWLSPPPPPGAFKMFTFCDFIGGFDCSVAKNRFFFCNFGGHQNILHPIFAYAYKDHVCQFVGQLDHFLWYFSSANKGHIKYKELSVTAKTLPFVFIQRP